MNRSVLAIPLIIMFSYVIASADDETKPEATAGGFEGTKAGEAKELIPGIMFHWCPAGTFVMGTPGATDYESPVEVTLTSGFWLAETEVTQGQWEKLMRTTPWTGQRNVKEGSDYAASYVSQSDAVTCCQKLTSQERTSGRLSKGWKYSLPTEAQWEYACRAGTKTKYSFGDSYVQLGGYGWFDDNAREIGERFAHQVGQKKSNPWGLKDMHGNVFEWCSDWTENKLQGGRDPVGPVTDSTRACRGGSWDNSAGFSKSAHRMAISPDHRGDSLGFRFTAVPQ